MTRRMLVHDWNDVERYANALAESIVGSARDSYFGVGALQPIGRGGVIPARLLADRLNLPMLPALRIQRSQCDGSREPPVVFERPRRTGAGLILVDDVVSSGMTLRAARDLYRNSRFTPSTAALISIEVDDPRRADFVGQSFDIAAAEWHVFPWDRRETMRRLDR